VGPAARAERVHLMRVIPEAARILIRGFVPLLLLGIVLFVPLGLLEALGVELSNFEGLHALSTVPAVVVWLLIAGVLLIGEVIYSGMVTRSVVDERRGESHSVRHVLSSLPYLRLVLADVLFVIAVLVGVLLLVIPGLLALAWFALVGPVIEVERRGIRAAFRRSRALVVHHFWRVAIIVLTITLASDYAGEWIQVHASAALGNSFGAEWAAATLAGMGAAPLFALPIAVLYLELAGAPSAEPAPESTPPATSSGTVTKR
jgi:hypothetical protein